MWFIQALRTVFHENVREDVFQMSCSWFLGVFLGLIWPKTPILGNPRGRPTSASFSFGNFSSQQVTLLSL